MSPQTSFKRLIVSMSGQLEVDLVPAAQSVSAEQLVGHGGKMGICTARQKLLVAVQDLSQ